MEKKNRDVNRERVLIETKKSKGDLGHALIIGGLPGIFGPVGSIFAALFGSVVYPPPITQRINQLLMDIAFKLEELEIRGKLEIDELLNNEGFISTLLHAIQIAIRTHQKEKLEALKNAVLNSALKTAPEDDYKTLFLSFIDNFTIAHVKILKFFYDLPNSPNYIFKLNQIKIDEIKNNSGGNLNNFRADQNFTEKFSLLSFDFEMGDISVIIPDMEGKLDLYSQVGSDLCTKGLLSVGGSSQLTMLRINWWQLERPQKTDLGELFLQFITSPLDDIIENRV
jgi:hypothetical protein